MKKSRRSPDIAIHARDLGELAAVTNALIQAHPESYVKCACGHQFGKHAPGGGKCSRLYAGTMTPCLCQGFTARKAAGDTCGCGEPAVDSRFGIPLCAKCYSV